jgi:hypothetical protein
MLKPQPLPRSYRHILNCPLIEQFPDIHDIYNFVYIWGAVKWKWVTTHNSHGAQVGNTGICLRHEHLVGLEKAQWLCALTHQSFVTCGRPTSVMEAGKEEQLSVLRFWSANGVGGWEIRHLSVVFCVHSMSRSRVLAWHKRFREGRVSLQDDARPGQAHCVTTPDVIAVLDGHIQANWRITSLFFFTHLHYYCWTTTRSANLMSSTINKGLVCKGTLSLSALDFVP